MHLHVFAGLFVFALVSAETITERLNRLKSLHEKCQSDPSTYLDVTIFDKFRHGEQVTDPNLSKHILCMHVEEGIQSQNGDIVLDKLREVLARAPGRNKEKVDEIISECGTKTSDNAEEAATSLSKCLLQHRSKQDALEHHHL